MPRRRLAAKLQKKAELAVAHEQNPEARVEVKRAGIAIGKRVRYNAESGGERWGVVREMHHKSVEIELTAGKLLAGGEDIVVLEAEVPFASVIEVLGDGRLADRKSEVYRQVCMDRAATPSGPPPPRSKGYETCDMSGCGKRPVMAYMLQKFNSKNVEIGMFDPPRVVAVCRDHDEKYEQPSNPNKGGIMQNPAHIPLLWQMGIELDSWRVPPPAGTEVEKPVRVPPPPRLKKEVAVQDSNPPRSLTDSPYEGVKGRHPRLCDCSRCMVAA